MTYSDEDISWTYNRTAGCCFYCGLQIDLNNYGLTGGQGAWTIDNLIPVFHNMMHKRDNFVPACMSCEVRKG
jgi:5-methylcytosine-specific restriction endonuclease McrA